MNRLGLLAGGTPRLSRSRRTASVVGALALVLSGLAGLAKPAAAISGGSNATAGQFPYIATVTTRGLLCTGALIRPEWVLTAGHCTDALHPYTMNVSIGGTTTAGVTAVAVAGARRHPAWPNQAGADPVLDLALIRLAAPVTTATVPLADPGESAAWDGPTDPLTAVGWGITGVNQPPATTLQTKTGTVTTTNGALVASFANGGVCSGDSGGPALVQTARGLVVAGALSKGQCGTGTYAMVGSGAGRDWLLSVLDSGPTTPTESPWTGAQATGSRSCLASASGRSTDPGEGQLVPGIPPHHTSWWIYDPPQAPNRVSTRVVVSTAGSTADTVVGVFRSTGDTLQHDLLSRWTQGEDDSQGTKQTLHTWLTAGGEPKEQVYLIGVGTRTADDTGRVCVQILPDYPLNDVPSGAVAVTGASGSTATPETAGTGDPAEGPDGAAVTVWYRWTATTGLVEFLHTGFGPVSVYRGDVVPGNRIAAGLNPRFQATAGETYNIGVNWPGPPRGGSLIWKQGTSLRYDGPASATYHTPITLQGTLTFGPGSPLPGRTVAFVLGTGPTAQICTGKSDANGMARCTIDSVEQVPGTVAVRLGFDGDSDFLPSTAVGSVTIDKRATVLMSNGPANVANDFPAVLRGTLGEQGGGPISARAVTFTLGTGSSAQSCLGITDGAGAAACTIPNVAQPADATSLPIRLAFAGDPFYKPSTAAATARLIFYTGRATGLSTKLLIFPTSLVSDTGEVSTAARSTTERAVVRSAGLVAATGIRANVTTGGGVSSATASTGDLTIGLPGLPLIRATNLGATSQSSCQIGAFTASASGSATLGSLRIGGVAQSVAAVGPNTVIRAGVLTITLNERRPVAGSSAGLAVTAMRISAPGVADVVVSLAKSDIHNCP